MCGVAAIFSFSSAAPPVERGELARIRDYMVNRGPDAKGEWFSPDGRLAMGHRRLSIIDLSRNGTQPMLNADRTLVLSFNGAIYNYKSIRMELEREGRIFRTETDTEVILHLYELKGEAMFHDLRGMFALAIWDQSKGALILGRDPYGIKPLYYANDGWTVRVASQVKALLAGGKISRQIDPAGHVGFFLFGSVPEPFTLYQEIRAVPAGSYIRVDDRGPSLPKVWNSVSSVYWSAKHKDYPTCDLVAKKTAQMALRDSVKHHLTADVPVGAFLSSGIDSSSVVGLMKDANESDIQTITLAFTELAGTSEDESVLAARTAEEYGTTHTTRYISEQEFRGNLFDILNAMDQPTVDGVNAWMVSKAASELGLKVCLSGLGGDELFGGYPSFKSIPRWVHLMRLPTRIPCLGEICRYGFQLFRADSIGLSPKAAGFVKYAGIYSGAYLLKRGLFMPWELPQVLDKELGIEGLRRLKVLDHINGAMQPDPGTPHSRVACLESSLYLRNQLLRDADWAGMAHSLEVRVPLVDSELLAAIAPITFTEHIRSGKLLLASAPTTPPGRELIERRKTGFSVPMHIWVENLRTKLDSWRRVPMLARKRCHWARRLAYAIYRHSVA